MGLFSKKPSQREQNDISQNIFNVQSAYRSMYDGCGVEVYVDCKNRLMKSMNTLLAYEKKYPSYFKHPTPTENAKKIQEEMQEVEMHFVDYTITYIEKKLLNYSTARGKTNNFNKETDKFKYYAGEFLPGTVEYFDKMLHEHFSEYIIS